MGDGCFIFPPSPGWRLEICFLGKVFGGLFMGKIGGAKLVVETNMASSNRVKAAQRP